MRTPRIRPLSVIDIQAHIEHASRERVLKLLLKVTTWDRLPNDPNDWKRNEEALRLYDQIAANPDYLEDGRRFLLALVENPQAQQWV